MDGPRIESGDRDRRRAPSGADGRPGVVVADGLIGVLDIGGTHVTAARVDVGAGSVVPGSRRRTPLDPEGPREAPLGAILAAASATAAVDVTGWGIAAPGPFDYERGVFRIRGVGKLEALHGVDLRAALRRALGLGEDVVMRFLNDADAFLLGETWAGAARGHAGAIGLTLGTGLRARRRGRRGDLEDAPLLGAARYAVDA